MTNNVELATELTIAWLSNSNTRAGVDEVPAFLARMHDALAKLASPPEAEAPADEPAVDHKAAVTVRKSLASPEHIVSMIDGKSYRSLKRHLSANGLTPDEYRQRYGLKADYPMVAPGYSEARREVAKRLGLGRKKVVEVAEEIAAPVAKAVRRTAAAARKAAKDHLGGDGEAS